MACCVTHELFPNMESSVFGRGNKAPFNEEAKMWLLVYKSTLNKKAGKKADAGGLVACVQSAGQGALEATCWDQRPDLEKSTFVKRNVNKELKCCLWQTPEVPESFRQYKHALLTDQ